jgi:uncharacterized protein HemX
MISHDNSSLQFEPTQKPSVAGYHILSITALIIGIAAIGASGFIATQISPLHQQVTEVTKKIQNLTSGSTEEITTLKQQITELDKTVKSQSSNLSKNDQSMVSLKNELSQIKKHKMNYKKD